MSLQPVSFSKRQAPQPRLSNPRAVGRHAETYWREEEDEILRAYFPGDGAPTCASKLPRRTMSAIYARAYTLGLKSIKQQDGPRKRHPADPVLDAKIREAWPGLTAKGAVQRFADSIGVDRWVISRRATALGLTKAHRRKEPNWTAAEDELMRKVPLHDASKASDIFKQHGFSRSATAIIVHAKRIGLSRRRSDVLSARGAAKTLGVDEKWITSRCIDGDLTAEKRGTARLVQQGGDTWAIRPEDLRRFIVDHLEEIDIRKVDKFAFVDLLISADDDGKLEPGPAQLACVGTGAE